MAPRGVGAAAKATPRIDVGESYTFGYTTKCLDKKGKPIREALRVFLKGDPTTGGATAALKRKPVYTNQAFDIILRTKEETKPGAYNMTVTVYGGTRCGLMGGLSICCTWRRRSRSGRMRSSWWFNGEKPAGYDTSLKLFAMGVGGQPYTWRITRGGDKVKIVNKVSNTAEVEGLRGSDDRFDVSVRVASGGVDLILSSSPSTRRGRWFFCAMSTRRTPRGATRPRFTMPSRISSAAACRPMCR